MKRASVGARFCAVGLIGFAVQLIALALLTQVAHWAWAPATVVAVECAIVHNYWWHERWTWNERFTGRTGFTGFTGFRGFLRFNLAAGATSILGNLFLMALLSGSLHLPVVLANAIAVAIISLVNFVLADRWVFRKPGVACALVAAGLVPSPAAAAPPTDALARWQEYVTKTEARLGAVSLRPPCAPSTGITADGDTIDAGPATISHWRAAVVIPNISLAHLLDRLQHPGTPPPQADIVSSRVLARGDDSLRVAIRLTRQAIVTVTYDTEHEMAFHRLSPTLATARSIATRIEEVGGGDHGFLWRLNSYRRYEQSGAGVLVQLESLTLSRDVPFLLKPIAGRIVPRIARESIVRTLEALRAYLA